MRCFELCVPKGTAFEKTPLAATAEVYFEQYQIFVTVGISDLKETLCWLGCRTALPLPLPPLPPSPPPLL